MAAGDMTVGFAQNHQRLASSLAAASVTLVGKPGELTWARRADGGIDWVHIVQA